MTTTDRKLISAIIALYEGIETATMQKAYSIGLKIQKVTDKKEAKAEIAKARNVKYSTIADYHRFYLSLEKTQIALQNEENARVKAKNEAKIQTAIEEGKKQGIVILAENVELIEAKQYNIVLLVSESKLLYTKMNILSKLTPSVLFEILSTPIYLELTQDLTVPETENLRKLINSDKCTIETALENAKKDKFTTFQENLQTLLTENAINTTTEGEETEAEPINYEETLNRLLKEVYNLNLSSFKTTDELLQAVYTIITDEPQEAIK